jgi:hypothetical protein
MLKVSIQIAVPEHRPADNKDGHFLCYDANSPIPWEKNIFVVTDSLDRIWFCHEFGHPLTDKELNRVATTIRSDYGEDYKRMSPLLVQLVAARVGDLDELRSMLSKIVLRTNELNS